jgi:hypothetical protein
MDNSFVEAIDQAKPIAAKAYPIAEIHSDRWLFGFDNQPYLFVVAPATVSQLGLCVLIVEQTAVARSIEVAVKTQQAIQTMQGKPRDGVLQ